MSGRALRGTWRIGEVSYDAEFHLQDEVLEGRITDAEGERTVEARVSRSGTNAVIVRCGGKLHRAVLARGGKTLWIALDGHVYELIAEEGTAGGRPGSSTEPLARSPMTGVVVKMRASPGDETPAGQELFVVEAMKMEFSVKAPRDVVVAEVRKRAGDRVDLGEPVVTFRETA
ncbi:MAG: acyl-CoA carboxylase biotin carboxyl carrier protein subunit [Planctomycetota bacterium]|jgi:acetyl-CoA/propionyl-CoA carboxylase biotin carboxyl carrier protein